MGRARSEEINDPIYRQVPLEGVAFSFLSALRAPAATLDSSGLTEESAGPDDLNPESLRHVSEGLQVVPGAFSLHGVFYFEMWLVSDFLFSALSSLVWFLSKIAPLLILSSRSQECRITVPTAFWVTHLT